MKNVTTSPFSASVVLILNYREDQQESMLKFGYALFTALQETPLKVSKWEPPRLFSRFLRVNNSRFGKWFGYCDKFIIGYLSLLAFRLLHPHAVWHIVDHSNSLYAKVLPQGRTVATCHDCIAIDEAFTGRTGEKVGRFGRRFQMMIAAGLSRCTVIACVSEATAADLRRLIAAKAAHAVVVHNGLLAPYRLVDEDTANRRLHAAGIPTDKSFIFMVGSNLIRKNRLGAIAIFNAFRHMYPDRDYRLVIAGLPWSTEVANAAKVSAYTQDIVEAGRLTDDALEAAYSRAAVVIFPSLAEGFGLPVVEAQACGAAVVTSNINPLPEVGGAGALYEDPRNPAKFAEAIYQATVSDHPLRIRALENVKRFDTAVWATRYVEIYRSLMPRGKSP